MTPINLSKDHICKQCSRNFKTKMELNENNEKVHIHDNWPDSGSKRDASMIKHIKYIRTQEKEICRRS